MLYRTGSSKSGAATKRWILQGLHSEAVHHIPVYYSTEHVAKRRHL
jgi:hypothetical protein